MSATQTAGRFVMGTITTVRRVYRSHPLAIWGAVVLSIFVLSFVVARMNIERKRPALINYEASTAPLVPATSSQPSTAKNVSSSTVQVDHTATQSTNKAVPQTATHVEVNGQTVPVPSASKGTIRKHITSSDGNNKTSVDISISSSGSSSDDSTFNLDIDSSQSSFNNSE